MVKFIKTRDCSRSPSDSSCESLDVTCQALRSIALHVVPGIAIGNLRCWDSFEQLIVVSLLQH